MDIDKLAPYLAAFMIAFFSIGAFLIVKLDEWFGK